MLGRELVVWSDCMEVVRELEYWAENLMLWVLDMVEVFGLTVVVRDSEDCCVVDEPL